MALSTFTLLCNLTIIHLPICHLPKLKLCPDYTLTLQALSLPLVPGIFQGTF